MAYYRFTSYSYCLLSVLIIDWCMQNLLLLSKHVRKFLSFPSILTAYLLVSPSHCQVRLIRLLLFSFLLHATQILFVRMV